MKEYLVTNVTSLLIYLLWEQASKKTKIFSFMASRNAVSWETLITYGMLFSLVISLIVIFKKPPKRSIIMGSILSIAYIVVATFVCELFYGIR